MGGVERTGFGDCLLLESCAGGGALRGELSRWHRGRGLFAKEGPAAGGGAGRSPAGGIGGLRLAARVHHGAELVEPVGCGESSGGQLPQGVLSLLPGQSGYTLEVIGEAGSAVGEQGTNLQGFGGEASVEIGGVDALGRERVGKPVGGLAQVEGDGGGVGGDHTAWGGTVA